MVRFLLVVLGLILCQPVLAIQGAPELAGRWNGTIDVPGSPLGVYVKLQKGKNWRGTIDIPAQDAAGVPLQDVQVEGKTITFAIANVPGEPIFDGTFSGGAIRGTFSQSGQSFPFTLTRQVPLSDAERTAALEQGRALTKLFYNRNFDKLYAEFSNLMKATSRAQLRELQQQLGKETSMQDETLSRTGDLLIYTRTVTFSKSVGAVAVRWVLDAEGTAQGFWIRPAEDAEAPSKRLE